MSFGNDWLFQVGVDTTQAETQIDRFIAGVTGKLEKVGVVRFDVKGITEAAGLVENVARTSVASTKAQVAAEATLTSSTKKRAVSALDAAAKIAREENKRLNLELSIERAKQKTSKLDELRGQSLTQQQRTLAAAEAIEEKVYGWKRKQAAADAEALALEKSRVQEARNLEAANANRGMVRTENSRGVGNAARSASVFQENFRAEEEHGRRMLQLEQERTQQASRFASALYQGNPQNFRQGGEAIDYMGRVIKNTMFHFIEYQVAMKAMEAVTHEFSNSLHEFSNSQFEQAMQRLYQAGEGSAKASQDASQAFTNAVKIARVWGSDIQDVQQVIGLWMKQTHDLAAATYLANEAEKLHAASGIETLEVYRSSIALSSQLGLKLKDMPQYYNMIAKAALSIAVPLKALGRSQEEGIRDIFQGVDKDAALLRSLGFELPQIIAINALQVQGLGEKGREAGQQLATMFAALATQGTGSGDKMKGAGVFEKIIGKDNIAKGGDALLLSFIQHTDELEKAFKQSSLKVKAQQGETFKAFLEYARKVKEETDKLRDGKVNGKAAVDLIAETSIATFEGQMSRLKTAVQAFSIALGNQMFPTAQKVVEFLYTTGLPTLEAWLPLLGNLTHAVLLLGTAFIAWSSFEKVVVFLKSVAAMEALAAEAGFQNATAMQQEARVQTILAESTANLAGAKAMLAQRNATLLGSETAVAEAEGRSIPVANDAALAQDRLALSTNAVAGAAARVPGAAAAASTGILAMGRAAASAMAPFVALAGAIQLAMSLRDSFDERKMVEAQTRNDLRSKGGFKSTLGALAHDPLGTIGDSLTQGFGQVTNSHAVDAVAERIARQSNEQGRKMRSILDQEAALRERTKGTYKASTDPFGHPVRALVQDPDAGKLNDQIRDLDAQKAHAIQNSYAYADAHPTDKMAKQLNADMKALWDKASQSAKNYAAGEPAKTAPFYEDPGDGKKKKKEKGAVSPESAFQSAIARDKRDASTAIQDHLQAAEAAKQDANAERDLAEVLGYTTDGLKKMQAAHTGAVLETLKAAAAAKAEVSVLAKQRAEFEAHNTIHGKTAAQLKQRTNALNVLTNAQAKAGEQADFYTRKAAAEGAQGMKQDAEYMIRLKLQKAGLEDLNTEISKAKKLGSKAGKGILDEVIGFQASETALNSLKAKLEAVFATLDPKIVKNSKMMAALRAEFANVGEAAAEAAGKAVDAWAKFDTTVDTLQNNIQSLAKENFDSLGTILGVSKSSTDFINTMLEGYKKIATERQKLDADETALKSDASKLTDPDELKKVRNAQAMMDFQRQQIDEQEKLLPLLAREKAMRDSIKESTVYAATQTAITSLGDKQIGKGLDAVFGKNPSALGGIIKDWAKTVADAWWKKASDSLTQQLFGIKSKEDEAREKLKAVFDKHVHDYEKIINKNGTDIGTLGKYVGDHWKAIDTFGGYVGKFTASADKLAAAQSGGGGEGSPIAGVSHLLGIDANGVPNFDGGSYNVGPQVDANGSFLPDGMSGAPDPNKLDPAVVQTIADNTTQMVDTMDYAQHSSSGNTGSGAVAGVAALFGIKLPQGVGTDLSKMFGKGGSFSGLNDKGNGNFGAQLSGAMTAYAGYQQGGASGALQAGLGAYEATGNPYIAAAAAAISYFHHKDDPSKMPDKYDPNYGQLVANMNGATGTFGDKTVSPDAKYDRSLGNRDEAQQLNDWLANSANYSMLTGDSLAQVQAAKALGSDLGVKSEKDGIVTLGSGQQMAVAAYEKMIFQLDQIKTNTGNTAATLAPLMSFNAYGAGAGYKGQSAFNMPGMNSAELAAFQNSPTPFSTYTGGAPNYFATPGVGGSQDPYFNPGAYRSVGGGGGQRSVQVIQLVADGKVLAQVVNAQNGDAGNRRLVFN